MWYLIESIPDLCSLSYFVLASHRYCSTHCVDVVDIWEKKKLNCKNYHFQELCFSRVSIVLICVAVEQKRNKILPVVNMLMTFEQLFSCGFRYFFSRINKNALLSDFDL